MVLGGQVGSILTAWKTGKFTLILSEDIITEYLDVLSRPKFHLNGEIIADLLRWMQHKAEMVTPSEAIVMITSDPSDNKFLEAIIAGNADCLVSGDHHLLALASFRGIPILTAVEFLQQFPE
jgi:hypothetical protein